MPFYQKIKQNTPAGKRTLERLLVLREGLKSEVPRRTLRENLLLATWNIRDFDKPAYGDRLDEAIYYIAEIISHFDLVALQEVYRDLAGLDRVMNVLGSNWKRIFTDATEGSGGNDERMVFLYDSRKVKFGGLSGEMVLPEREDQNGVARPVTQLVRTPFVAGFRSGWTRFMLATVHITWAGQLVDPEDRVREIREVAQFFKKRTMDETAWARNLLLLGDFNIFGTDDLTFQQLTDAGFEVPDELLSFRSNALKSRHYDQIAFRVRPGSLDKTGNAGVFDFYQYVFSDSLEDRDIYTDFMQESIDSANQKKSPSQRSTPYNQRSERSKTNYYRTYWRTHQMSDHLPMWVELRIDYSDEYLKYKLDKSKID
jgi:endonuclease/exonuclease/phosphatase family metal-dependent hydrolase